MTDNKNFTLPEISFFCPAYHDEDNLPRLISHVHKFLSEISGKFEIIIVEDGSPDRTGEVADSLAGQYPEVRVIHHPKNMGYGAALRDGFLNARYAYVMYTDGDFQYDVTEFRPHLHLFESTDVLSGYASKKVITFRRKLQSQVYNWLIAVLFFVWTSPVPSYKVDYTGRTYQIPTPSCNLLWRILGRCGIKDIDCAMKIYKRKVLDSMEIKSTSAFIDAEMLIKASKKGFKIAQFQVTQYTRKSGPEGGSKWPVILATIKDMVKYRLGLL